MFTGPYKTSLVNPASLVGWWKLDDAAGTDSSPLGNTGTLHGPLSPVIGPAASGALGFDGSSNYIEVPTAVVSGGDATFAAWILKNAGGGASQSFLGVFQNVVGNRNSLYLTFGGGTGNQLSLVQFITNTFHAVSGADPTISTGIWTHVAATFIGATGAAVVYANGQSVGSGTLTTGWPFGLTPGFTEIGAQFNNATTTYIEFFGGSIDDVRIYNRALSADEILEVYAIPFQPPIDLESVPFIPPQFQLMGQIWLA